LGTDGSDSGRAFLGREMIFLRAGRKSAAIKIILFISRPYIKDPGPVHRYSESGIPSVLVGFKLKEIVRLKNLWLYFRGIPNATVHDV
jgi:hypothetical protein